MLPRQVQVKILKENQKYLSKLKKIIEIKWMKLKKIFLKNMLIQK
uniref:Uncharacterized protein n=1 Tax=Meloidogyne enterolobii TaxID=390850 RepID=A0A6V7WH87_MELEN|nr:unnamed protein product [Meloidogyne enterolobii]